MSSLLENVISCISTEKFDVTGKVEMRFNFLKICSHSLVLYFADMHRTSQIQISKLITSEEIIRNEI